MRPSAPAATAASDEGKTWALAGAVAGVDEIGRWLQVLYGGDDGEVEGVAAVSR